MRALKLDDFSKSILTLVSGAAFAQAIPIAISPILTRLYAPGDFGLLAVFLAVTAIMGSVATGRYELAIVLPEDDRDAIHVTVLTLIVTLVTSVLALIVVVPFNEQLAKWLGNPGIAPWLYLVPTVTFLGGLQAALTAYNNRLKAHKVIAQSLATKAVAGAGVQLGLGVLRLGPAGLLAGHFVSCLAGTGSLAARFLANKAALPPLEASRLRDLAYRYQDFPKYSVWGGVANAMAQNVISVLLSATYAMSVVGHYALVQRVLGVPMSMVGSSVTQAFIQRAAEEKNRTGAARHAFDATIKRLLVLALPTFTLLYFVVEEIFALVFGEAWRIAGQYARILVPLYFMRFMVVPVTLLTGVFGRQRLGLLCQLTQLALVIGTFASAFQLQWTIERFLVTLCGVLCAYYAGLFVIFFRMSRGTPA